MTPRRFPDIGKARHLLEWQTDIALETGLELTLTYFHAEVALSCGAEA